MPGCASCRRKRRAAVAQAVLARVGIDRGEYAVTDLFHGPGAQFSLRGAPASPLAATSGNTARAAWSALVCRDALKPVASLSPDAESAAHR